MGVGGLPACLAEAAAAVVAVMAVIVESRPELVGKRFLCVGAGGEEPRENGRWRAGVIRTVSHRDSRSPELSVSLGSVKSGGGVSSIPKGGSLSPVRVSPMARSGNESRPFPLP